MHPHADDYRVFVDSLRSNLKSGQIEELPLHINDNAFADACIDSLQRMLFEIPIIRHETDVLIVGGGAAGPLAAFECANAGVGVIQATKGRATSGTTTWLSTNVLSAKTYQTCGSTPRRADPTR